MKQATVVILAAGLGTRMRSKHAKVLHRAGGDTLLNQVIRAALELTPADRIIVVVGHQAGEVQKSVTRPGVRFALQSEQRGTGHAVLCARQQVLEAGAKAGSPLLVLNGDGPLLRPETLRSLLNSFDDELGAAILTTVVSEPYGYGRILRDAAERVEAIVEEKVADAAQKLIREINPGVYCFHSERFWAAMEQVRPDNPAGEYYLTDAIALLNRAGFPVEPVLVRDETELLGINTRVELAVADRILRNRKTRELMLSGVTIEYPETVTVDVDVQVGADTVIESGAQLRGTTVIGEGCRVGAGSLLQDCRLADGVTVFPYVVAEHSSFGTGACVGPFARLRMNAEAAAGSQIGNFVELKKTRLGEGAKANHLAYLGDGTVGAGSNIGAGTIFCNYDGVRKHPTVIGERAFVGSNSTLVAPVEIGDGAYVAAGSAITRNVEGDSLALGRAQQVDKPGWAKKRREKQLTGTRS